MSLCLRSPAKINLFLHVHAKRHDGYHDLSTLIHTISLFDCVTLELDDSDHFHCLHSAIQSPQNLAVRARDLFRMKTGWIHPVSITLDKKIPIEAGLGGGSGNAATVLWGMNQLSGLDVAESELQNWSAELGSDIPFYFSRGVALCEGRGERVTNIDDHRECEMTLVKPEMSLKTPEVFQAFRATSNDRERSQKLLCRFQEGFFPFENDLEAAAFSLSPKLRDFKNDLLSLTSSVSMSGSGSAFFCLGHHRIYPGYQSWPVLFHYRQNGEWY